MSMSAPKHAEEIEQAKAAEKALRIKYTVGLVHPNGLVQQVFAPPPMPGSGSIVGQQRGDVKVLWMNGSPQVVARWAKKGFRLFSEVCETDGVPELYQRWHDYLQHQGTVKVTNVEALYPPTVHRMRRESESGVVEGKVYDGALGLVDATDDNRAERIAALADAAGIGRPTKQDRQTAKATV